MGRIGSKCLRGCYTPVERGFPFYDTAVAVYIQLLPLSLAGASVLGPLQPWSHHVQLLSTPPLIMENVSYCAVGFPFPELRGVRESGEPGPDSG